MSRFCVRAVPTGFKFDLHAGNGEIILSSEVYKTRTACRRGIESVLRAVARAKFADQTFSDAPTCSNPKFELYRDRSGEFRFRLRARNGEIVATSEPYTTRAACENGIESTRKNAPTAQIIS